MVEREELQRTVESDDAARDEQVQAERLDEDKLGVDDVAEDAGDNVEVDYPPDLPTGADRHGVTADEQSAGESLEDQVRQEEPERAREPSPSDVGPPVDPSSDPDVGATDQAVASEGEQAEEPAAAEEAALHRTEPPPHRAEDSYRD